jgi:hypothetical protein
VAIVPEPAICVGVKRAAEIIGVSPGCVRAFIGNGQLPVVKLPPSRGAEAANRRVLIAVADLQAFVDRHREVTR